MLPTRSQSPLDMKRLLLVTDRRFWRDKNGSSSRIHSLFSSLHDEGYSIGLFFIGILSYDERLQLQNKGIECVYNVTDGRTLIYNSFSIFDPNLFLHFPRYLLKLWYRFCHVSFPYEKFYHRKSLQYFEEYLDNFDPDMVIVEYLSLSFLTEVRSSNERLWILDSHDVMHLRYESHKIRGLLHWISVTKDEEISALSRFDAVIAIQQDEASIFRSMVSVPVLTIPHALSVVPVPACSYGRFSVGFLAADSDVNYDGLSWFILDVWSLIVQLVPNACLIIGGDICRKLTTFSCDSIKIIGHVESLVDFYSVVDIVVNPVFSGGGLKIKNIEALSYGVPLVTTPIGAQGLVFDDSPSFLIAESNLDFADRVVELITSIDLRNSLRIRGLECVNEHFSCDCVYKPLIDFIEEHS